jgi:NADPH:quinone reductase
MQAANMVPGAQSGIWDIRDVQRPVISPGHVLARVHASSLNRAEMRAIRNLRLQPGKLAPAERPGGGDAAGEVVAVGEGVTGFKPGDRVMGRCAGGFAEYALIDAREAMTAPESLSWEEAACVPIVFVVVHDALYASAQLRAGETVLVTAASSGVGVATLLLGKLIGAKVIGTSRSAEKLERLKGFGLDAGVVTGSDGFGAAIAGVIGEEGVDMIIDNICGDIFAPCLDALAVGGRFCTIGRMSGVLKGALDLDRLALRRLHLYGVSNRLRKPAQRAESTKRFVADLMPALSDGRLKPIVDRSFALSEIADAQAYLEADKHVGKVVVRI